MSSYLIFEIDGQKVRVPHYDYVREEEGMTPELVVDRVYRCKKFNGWYEDALTVLRETQVPWSEERLRSLAFKLALYDLLTYQGYKRVHQSLGSSNPTLSNHERQVFEIMMSYLKDKPEYMLGYFNEYDIFPALLYKEGGEGINCLSQFNKSLKNNPKLAIEVAFMALKKRPKFPEDLHQRLDHWLAQQLVSTNFKKYASEKRFFRDINLYLECSPTDSNEVCSIVFNKIDVFGESEQDSMWHRAFFEHTSEKRISSAVKGYLCCEHNEKSNKIFYQYFHNLPRKLKAKILGEASEFAQRNYLRILKQQNANLDKAKIEDPSTQKTKFLLWDLSDKKKVSEKDLIQAIQNEKLEKRREPARHSFIFHDKTKFDKDIFKAGCQKVKDSTFGALMWINSFSKTSNFSCNLASLWAELPRQIRQNKNIQLSCDNHFDLFYHLAEEGNTSMLNEIKQTMKDESSEFMRRLMRPHADGDTCLHLLCYQGKKGILNILKELPKEQQKELLSQKNDMGQTPLDMCSSDFRRFLDQKNFIRPASEVQKTIASIKKEPKITAKKQPDKTDKPVKKFIWRPRFKSKRYIDDCKKFANQPNVIKGAWREMAKLRSMPWTDLQLRMGQDIKRSFKSRLCAADFAADGNAYRMGYILQDGVVGVLFIMTHQQYNTELQCKGPLDAVAQNVRNQISAQVAQQKRNGR